jgi:hypothetical protein
MTTYLFNTGHLLENGIKKTLNQLNPGLLNIMNEIKFLLKKSNPSNLRDSKLLKNQLLFALGEAYKNLKTINFTSRKESNKKDSNKKEKLFC